MRTTLRYGAAIGIMASAFSTLGPVSAYAGQIPGGSAPVTAVQQAGSPDSQQGQIVQQRHRHCVRWYYRYHHRYCARWVWYR